MVNIRRLKWSFVACNVEEDANLTKELQCMAELFNGRHSFEKVRILNNFQILNFCIYHVQNLICLWSH